MPVNIKNKNRKVNDKKLYNKIKPYIKGVVIGNIFFFIGVVISALIIYKSDISSTFVYVIPLVFEFFGAFFCGVSVQKNVGGRGFLIGALSSLPFIATALLFVCVIVGFKVDFNVLIVIPIGVLGGFTGGITAVNTRI